MGKYMAVNVVMKRINADRRAKTNASSNIAIAFIGWFLADQWFISLPDAPCPMIQTVF